MGMPPCTWTPPPAFQFSTVILAVSLHFSSCWPQLTLFITIQEKHNFQPKIRRGGQCEEGSLISSKGYREHNLLSEARITITEPSVFAHPRHLPLRTENYSTTMGNELLKLIKVNHFKHHILLLLIKINTKRPTRSPESTVNRRNKDCLDTNLNLST